MAPNHPNRSRKRIAASVPPVPMADVEPDTGVKARIKRMRQATFNAGAPPPPFRDVRAEHDADYARLLALVGMRFDEATNGRRVFRTDATGLYKMFIDGLRSEKRAHTCRACERFIESYGGLVVIDEAGETRSALWDATMVPAFYHFTISRMQATVNEARVIAPFLHEKAILGEPVTGNWTHFSVEQRGGWIWRPSLLTLEQATAALKHRFETVRMALETVSPAILQSSMQILQADEINRSEKFVGPLKWLIERSAEYHQSGPHRMRDNRLWRSIAEAPEGFCHPRASVLGSLFEDVRGDGTGGKIAFQAIRDRFNAKVHGLAYQRPKADPAAQTIERAEKLFAELGLAPALERRFARLDEVETIWRARRVALPMRTGRGQHGWAGRVFARVQAANPEILPPPPSRPEVPLRTMTWVKFAQTVLPGAEAMDFCVPSTNGNFQATTTAVQPTAPRLLKWDNPFGHYVYNGGSPAAQWGLSPGWCRVLAISLRPNLWGDKPQPHLGIGGTLILEGAADVQRTHLCLFPETIRDELHEVRSVIEAFARQGKLQDAPAPLASGYGFGQHGLGPHALRAYAGGVWQHFHIDRWD